ncbi:MAG: type II toxin-antitoxin system VapC family toxin [Deltaproteobacteria bacterium]|nr:type II toxin-antitoxin system VapC family toxin [Deltaproteobacteria bacterium]
MPAEHLLDTCALLWWMADAPELGKGARRLIGNPKNRILISVASLWEIAIKSRKGTLSGVESYLGRYDELHDKWGFHLLAIEPQDAVAAGLLDVPHSDPIDRMLIVQSHRVRAPIVTCDAAITKFALATVW